MAELKDWRGTAIEEGSIIVYPVRARSSLWMVEAKVVIVAHEDSWPFTYRRHVLRVVPLRASDGFARAFGDRVATISRLDRVTVVGEKVV